MNKRAYQYAIARFAPFVETGEFANVGIVLIGPKDRYFGFKLQTRRYGRVTRFFDEIEPRLYRNTLFTLRDELHRVHAFLKTNGFDKRLRNTDVDFANAVFVELIRPRETIVKFSAPRTLITDDPEKKLAELFSFYIERNFVTKEYRETVLEKGVRRWLFEAQVGERFQRTSIGDDEYQATFPFVQLVGNEPIKVIKPLHLAHDKPSKIIDHGGAWLFRIGELKRRNRLPSEILLAVSGPKSSAHTRRHAFDEMTERFREVGAEVVDYEDKRKVVDFARA